MDTRTSRTLDVSRAGVLPQFHPATAAAIAGLIGGVAYLLAQIMFSGVLSQHGPWAPLNRIAAILLGSGEAPPDGDVSFVIVTMALLIHLPAAAIYGRWIGLAVGRLTLPAGIGVGAICGLALYALNFYLIAPSAFPWFVDSRNAATAFDHAMFGALVAALALLLSRPRSAKGAAAA